MADHITSTSDERVANNVMRHEYRVLSESEKQQMQAIKDKGLEFYNLLLSISDEKRKANPMTQYHATFTSRELSIAATKIEEAVMWAVKHLTK